MSEQEVKPVNTLTESFTPTVGNQKSPPSDKKIPVVELFGPTIEGEGKLIGTQTHFIRFGLCDYKCRKCDSMHAVEPSMVKALAAFRTQEEIFAALKEHAETHNSQHVKNVTFSGGNPAIHDLTELCVLLKADGWKIFVETQGTKHPSWFGLCDEIVCSPKSPGMGEAFEAKVFEEFVQHVAELGTVYGVDLSIKVVVFSAQDLEFAVGVADLARRAFAAGASDYDGAISEHWLHNNFFLSLGNPYPPQFGLDVVDGKMAVVQGFDYPELNEHVDAQPGSANDYKATEKNTLASVLLNHYNQLCEEIMKDPRLGFAKFLPQLHVLVYGNEAGK